MDKQDKSVEALEKHLEVLAEFDIAAYCHELTQRNKNSPDPLVRMFFGPHSQSAFADSDKRSALIDVPSILEALTEEEILMEYFDMTSEEAQHLLQFRDMHQKLQKYENFRRECQQ